MNRAWSAELWRLALILGAALLFGLTLGVPALLVALALLAYLGWHLRNLYRLERWLRDSHSIHPPDAEGIWGEVFHLLYRSQQRNRKRKRRLAGILNRFQQATSALPDATVVLGAHDEIEWFNNAAKRLLGLNTASDVGQRIDNLLRNPRFITLLDSEEDQARVQMASPVDSTLTLQLRIVPYGRKQRLLIARDITRQLRLEQTQRDFVANVSHELRTPLTVITGYLETLVEMDAEGSGQWQRSLELMSQQSERMRQIVEDLLLLSRLESGAGLTAEVVAVAPMIETIAGALRVLCEEKGQSLELELDHDLRLRGAERELYSAFFNLATNAHRYTPSGGRISLRWYRDEDGAHFEVQDSGVGIPPEHIPRLTERFYRVDVGRSREAGGTGLGLAIVKHVLSRHQAQLYIESTPGHGSLFSCDFPPEAIDG